MSTFARTSTRPYHLGAVPVLVAVGALFGACHGGAASTGGHASTSSSSASSSSASSSGTGGMGGAGGELPPLTWAERFPQIQNGGGPVLAGPSVQPVFFANEAAAKITLVQAFLGKLAGSAYWAATTGEYGVGPLTAAAPITLTEAAPAATDQASIEAWILDALTTGKLPAPADGVIHALYYPSGTTITDDHGGVSCVSFGGYHDEVDFDGMKLAYTVVPHCDAYAGKSPFHFPGGLVLQGDGFVTGLSSHELVEAATDPAVSSAPAYQQIDAAHLPWIEYLVAGETADSCEFQPGAFYEDPELGYLVQATWSNAAALAGRDPCVPSSGKYVGAFPRVGVELVAGFLAYAIAVADGSTATIPIELAGEDPASPPWTVTPIDFETTLGGAARLELTLDRTTGKNGDVLMLTIKALSHDSKGLAGFILESTLGGKTTRVPGLVTQP